jgi:hypothetical protein
MRRLRVGIEQGNLEAVLRDYAAQTADLSQVSVA